MSFISLKWFGGMVPRRGRQHLDVPTATEAENCNLYSGELRPLKAPALAHVFCRPSDECWRDPLPDDPSVPPVEPPEPPNCIPVAIQSQAPVSTACLEYDCNAYLDALLTALGTSELRASWLTNGLYVGRDWSNQAGSSTLFDLTLAPSGTPQMVVDADTIDDCEGLDNVVQISGGVSGGWVSGTWLQYEIANVAGNEYLWNNQTLELLIKQPNSFAPVWEILVNYQIVDEFGSPSPTAGFLNFMVAWDAGAGTTWFGVRHYNGVYRFENFDSGQDLRNQWLHLTLQLETDNDINESTFRVFLDGTPIIDEVLTTYVIDRAATVAPTSSVYGRIGASEHADGTYTGTGYRMKAAAVTDKILTSAEITALHAELQRNYVGYVDPDPNCGAVASYFLGDRPVGIPLVLSVTVNADATAPTSYQWYRNGIALPGEVGPVYSFTTTAEDSYASYFVVVQNPCGQEVSEEWLLGDVGYICLEYACDAIATELANSAGHAWPMDDIQTEATVPAVLRRVAGSTLDLASYYVGDNWTQSRIAGWTPTGIDLCTSDQLIRTNMGTVFHGAFDVTPIGTDMVLPKVTLITKRTGGNIFDIFNWISNSSVLRNNHARCNFSIDVNDYMSTACDVFPEDYGGIQGRTDTNGWHVVTAELQYTLTPTTPANWWLHTWDFVFTIDDSPPETLTSAQAEYSTYEPFHVDRPGLREYWIGRGGPIEWAGIVIDGDHDAIFQSMLRNFATYVDPNCA